MCCLTSRCSSRPHDVDAATPKPDEKRNPCCESIALVAKVGLVGAAAFAVYSNWGQIASFFANMFTVISAAAKAAIAWVVANPVLAGAIAIAALVAWIALQSICCCCTKKDDNSNKGQDPNNKKPNLPEPPAGLKEAHHSERTSAARTERPAAQSSQVQDGDSTDDDDFIMGPDNQGGSSGIDANPADGFGVGH